MEAIALVIGVVLIFVNSIVLGLMERERRRIRDALKAFEEAFACDLTGKEPHINVMDYPMGDQMWMVPCRKIEKSLKQ